jgi:hypothetical protein
MDTMRKRSASSSSSSINDSVDRSGTGSSLRRRSSSITSLTAQASNLSYWQQKGYTKVASLDHLNWDIISRSAAYHVEAGLPELEVLRHSHTLQILGRDR